MSLDLYSGIVGGSYYGHTGGGGEYVCLPNNPKYNKYQDGFQSHSFMYGTEYQMPSSFNPFKNKLNDHDPHVSCVTSRLEQLS